VPDAPVLLSTASADQIDADPLVAAGISEVVHRPLVSAELASALPRHLQSRGFAPAARHADIA
jgi:CheY-like chemotaxis protein